MIKKRAFIVILAFAFSCTQETPKPNPTDDREKFIGKFDGLGTLSIACLGQMNTITNTSLFTIQKEGAKLKILNEPCVETNCAPIYGSAKGNTITTEPITQFRPLTISGLHVTAKVVIESGLLTLDNNFLGGSLPEKVSYAGGFFSCDGSLRVALNKK